MIFFQCKIFSRIYIYIFFEITQYTPPQKSNGRSLIKDTGQERERRPIETDVVPCDVYTHQLRLLNTDILLCMVYAM